MKPLYNSEKGRTKRPRKVARKIGEMPKHLQRELTSMSRTEAAMLKITASFALINLGVNLIKTI